ncbi:isopenicillin N synthase family oxygenase [Microbispora cellulosiformans]|uniref:Isopenicillin N synthase family oxygenase n=1 Tax=Microbispora cellulosiformans TaxID=2614688 RepID=A0A5J5KAT2_9ACTN|nr:2-oxoglutarate and iron-dependent oxygenase domain-containing protein [Microbispora cellulosiformans]KAA9380903.1 isopenicillin N synthase family oxygenase [Microbispora cellulosiformans]
MNSAVNPAGNTAGPLPVIDVSPFTGPSTPDTGRERAGVARRIEAACLDSGFFYISGHGVPDDLIALLREAAARFFLLPPEHKMRISMDRGGRAWRGYFPVGGELTSGRPDLKEGLYFGADLGREDPRPLHGPNLYPEEVPELRSAVRAYMDALTGVGQAVMRGVALSLGLEEDYFASGYTATPTVLFRIFHYPPAAESGRGEWGPDEWGVGEHTDYGLLTLLLQDGNPGLQVHTARGWIEAPPIPGTLVCNIGDMLDRLTGGLYRSTPHRVRNHTGRGRLSFPFFFDPGWDCEVPPLPSLPARDGGRPRWDGLDLRAFTGTYGDYLTAKVAKVFPHLGGRVLSPPSGTPAER